MQNILSLLYLNGYWQQKRINRGGKASWTNRSSLGSEKIIDRPTKVDGAT
jgi:hypothetical protein